MLTHLTPMPVCLVKAFRAARGRESAASATVIVTPDVLSDAAELPPLLLLLLPPPQAASTKASAAAPAAVAVWPSRPRLLRRVLATAPLLRYTAIAEVGYGGSVLAYAHSAARSDAHLCASVHVTFRIGILQSMLRSRQGPDRTLSAHLAIMCA